MMRSRTFGPVALALLVVAGLGGSLFVVDATEVAVRTRFGRPIEVLKSPGLKFKLPLIDDIARFDARLLYFDPPPAEFLTEDKKNISISTFVVWRIHDPLRFLQSVYTRSAAEARVADLVASEAGAAIAAVPFSHLISVAPGEARLGEVATRVGERVKQRSMADHGIEVVEVGVRRLAFPDQNLESVFSRMRAERERIARGFRSEGEEEASKIRARATSERSRLLAEAYRKAQELKGRGEAEAAKIYAEAMSKDPELYRFLRTLEAYEKMLDGQTTLILPADADLLRLLTEGPGPGQRRR